MKRKLLTFIIFLFVIDSLSIFISVTLFGILFAIGFLFGFSLITFIIINKFITQSNWWKNQYKFTKQFVSNEGYRDNIVRNYDIVNLGSNPALYAFFYENVKGQNWSTGSQGQDMDFEILKYFHSYIKEGGIVLIPIMPFTAIAPYIKTRKTYWGIEYYSKFAKILSREQTLSLPYGKTLLSYLRWPLIRNPKSLKYVFCDVPQNNDFMISEQPMMKIDLQQDAERWMKEWMAEFNLQCLSDVMCPVMRQYYNEAVQLSQSIVNFCLERNLKPVFICLPQTKYINDLFPENIRKYLITDFIDRINVHNVPFLDYTYNPKFQDESLYINSLFLNLRGRKYFSNQLISDLGIII